MDENALVVSKVAEVVRFDLVFLGFGIIDIALAGVVSPSALYHRLFANEIGGLNRVRIIRREE